MSIAELIGSIERGEICIPRGVQRGFIWSSEKVLKLADSIYRRYPIGIVIFWDISQSTRGREIATGIVEIAEREYRPRYLVIDGLQRLTSFVLIKYGSARVVSTYGGYQRKRINLYFNPETEEFSLSKTRTGTWFKVADVFDDSTFSKLLAEIAGSENLSSAERKEYIGKLQKLRETLSISIPIYIISEETSLDDLVEIFDRINSAGTRVTISHIVVAYLPELADEILSYLNDMNKRGWKFKIPTLVKVLSYRVSGTAFVAKLRDDISKGRVDRNKLREEWTKVKKAVDDTVSLLKSELHIHYSKYVPSETSLSMISTLISIINDEKISRNTNDNKILALLLLLSSYLRRYTGSTEQKMDEDVAFFVKELKSQQNIGLAVKRLLEKWEKIYGSLSIPKEEFRKPTQLNKTLLYFALCENGAIDFYKGIKIESLIAQEDFTIHHIFPRDILRGKYERGQIDDIANLTILSRETNKIIGSKNPENYLRKINEKILSSHFIPLDKELWKVDNYLKFVERRRELIVNFVNNRIYQILNLM